MITPSFGLTATERVLPKLALDFTTASLDPRITFTRTTVASNPATYTNNSGLIVLATNNQPRFDYDPLTLTCKGLLIEESRANLLLQSEDFSTTWIPTAATISVNQTVAPDGNTTADKIIATTTASTHYITQAPTVAINTTLSFSCYIKAAEYSTVGIGFQGNGVFSTTQAIVVNLTNGAAVIGSGTPTYKVTSVNDGWWRINITATGGATGLYASCYIFPINGTTYADRLNAGDGTSGIYIWGAQLELGAFATSYIPTTTTALTRNADIAAMTGTNFSDWYNASEGSLSANFTSGGDTLGTRVFDITDTGGNNRAAILGSTGGGSGPYFLVVSGGATQASTTAGTFTVNTTYTVVGGYKVNSFAASINGAAPSTDASGIVPNVPDKAYIGTDGTNYLNGWVKKLAYWPQRLINAEIQAFSK